MADNFRVRREGSGRVRVSIDRSGVEMLFQPGTRDTVELVAGGAGTEGATRGEIRRAHKAAVAELKKETADVDSA